MKQAVGWAVKVVKGFEGFVALVLKDGPLAALLFFLTVGAFSCLYLFRFFRFYRFYPFFVLTF